MRFLTPLALAFLLASPTVHANIRAPLMLDGSFSEHARGAHPDAVLLRERFVARMPELIVGHRYVSFTARVEVEYDIENVSAEPIDIPVRFLTIGVDDAHVRLNGAEVAIAPVKDDDERRAALARILRHRCEWQEAEIRGMGFVPCHEDIDAGVAFMERRRIAADLDVDSLAFDVRLAPGKNTIAVAYGQRVRVREGPYGYFTGTGIRGAQLGFEYLLYPAESWRRAEDFTFDVRVEVPDVRERGLFGDTFTFPTFRTNLPLVVSRTPHRSATASATLREFPAEVLAVIVDVPAG